MSKLVERFLKYVKYDTQSSETSGTHPASEGQRVLVEELLSPNAPSHREIRLAFTPDEEIGEGTYVGGHAGLTVGRSF